MDIDNVAAREARRKAIAAECDATLAVYAPTFKPRPAARLHSPLPATMTIYFIRSAAGPVKIGRARRIEFRLRELRLSSPVALDIAATVEGPPDLERQYHHKFAAHRLHGEWFTPAPEILAEIERLNAGSSPQTGSIGYGRIAEGEGL